MNLSNKKKIMTYFTSWDVNVFLCLVTLGVPEDVVKMAVMTAKRVHEGFNLGRAMTYWASNSPSMVRVNGNLKFIHGWTIRDEWDIQLRSNTWQNRRNVTIEFKKEWRLRSIEERKAKVIEWCKFGEEREQIRHQDRLSNISTRGETTDLKGEMKKYTKNLWKTWEAGASSYYFVGQGRRNYISEWYEGIHPGRFFLFYRENKIIEERNKGIPKGPCEDGYQYPKIPIYDWGPYEQLIEDLRCIDGPGLGEYGSHIEHIDDIFSK